MLYRQQTTFFYSQQTVKPSADTAVRRWRRLDALGGRGLWPPSAAGEGRAHGRGQEGKDNQGFLSPLNSPNFPLSRSAKHSRLNGGYGGSVPCVGQLMGRCIALNLLSTACTGSASIKWGALKHKIHLWAPRISPRNRRASRRKGGFGGVKRGKGNHTVPFSPFAPAVGTAPPCRWAPKPLGRGDGQSRLQRRTAVSAEGFPSAEGKERKSLCRRLAAKGGALFRERPTGKSLIYLKYFTPFANSG